MTTPITLPYLDAYIDRLRTHDWYFERADDPRPYKAGLAADQKLRREAESEPLLRDLYECAAYILGTHRIDARPTQWQCWLTFDEFCEVTRRRLAAQAAPRADVTHQLARMVRALAGALARADRSHLQVLATDRPGCGPYPICARTLLGPRPDRT